MVTVNALFDRYFCNHRKTLTAPDATALEYAAGDDRCVLVMDTSNLTHVLAHTLSILLSRSVYTIAQRDLVFRLRPSANALIGRSDGSGIMDMKLKVFANLNNFPMRLLSSTKNAKTDPHARMNAMRGAIAFVGVALQPVDFTNKNSKARTV